ncbi:MAG TPA: phage tail length tape measure family protein [Burkholderiaceae bacterium]|nr:phage tail length tape measure family protein [Burkholderiaceae bacterium]
MADGVIAAIVLSAEDKTGPAYQSAIKHMQALQAQAKQSAGALDKIGSASQLNTQQMQGLVHSVRAFTDSVLAGQSPLRAFAIEFGKLSGTFGGAGNALSAITGLLSPVRLALTAVAAAVAAIGTAFYASAKASKEFKDAVTLSGNFAGQTAGQFDATAKRIAAQPNTTVTVGEAKEAGQALIQTGEVGPQVFAAATEAVARYAKATGQTAKDVAKDFAGMSGDVLKWATEHNRQLNFVTTKQLQQIKTLQDTGREVDAQALVYDALNERFRQLDANLGPIDRLLNTLAKSWSEFWNAAKGDADTVEARVEQARRALEAAQQRRDSGGSTEGGLTAEQKRRIDAFSTGRPTSSVDQVDIASENLRLLSRERSAGERNAADAALRDEEQKEGAAARRRLDAVLEESQNRLALSKALQENARDFERARKAGKPYTAEEQAAIDKRTRQKFTDPKIQADVQATLEARIKGIKNSLSEEEDQLKFHNDFLSGLYQAGEISLRTYYDEQRKVTEQGVAARLDAFAKERAAVEKALAKTDEVAHPDEVKKLKAQRADIDSQAAKTRQRAAEDVIISNQREAASFKALQEQIASFQEQLLQESGDTLGAELTRIETTIKRIKVLAGQSQKTPGGAQITDDQVKTLEQQLIVRARLNESQREFQRLTAQAANAEELLLLQAKNSGRGLLDTEDALHALREKALAQLGDFIDRERERVALSKDPADLQHLDDLIVKYQQLQATVDPRKLRFEAAADDIGSALASGFDRASEAGAKLSDILKDIGSQIARIITRELVSKPIGESIANFIKGTGSSGGGGLLDWLTNITRPKPDKGVGLGTETLTDEQRRKALDHDTTPVEGAAPLGGTTTASTSTVQAAAIDKTTTALQALADAANAASTALGKPPGTVTPGGTVVAPPGADTPGATTYAADTTGENYGNESRRASAQLAQDQATATAADQLGKSLTDTRTDTQQLSDVVAVTSATLRGLGQSGNIAANALSLLPALMASLSGSSSEGGSGGGIWNSLLNLAVKAFTGGSGGVDTSGAQTTAIDDMLRERRATGGQVKAGQLVEVNEQGPELITVAGRQLLLMGSQPGHITPHTGLVDVAQAILKRQPAPRRVDTAGEPLWPWEDAQRYHDGGVVGHEVPAILMGGPKGLREEVLTADDPRHTDNGGGARQALHIYVTPPPGMSRDSATQQGVLIGQGIQRVLRRNGG